MSLSEPTRFALSLGLYEDIKNMSIPCNSADMYNADGKFLGSLDANDTVPIVGYSQVIFARPRLYELLLKQVPSEKITLRKKVLRTEEKEGKMHIYCSDNTSYEGDILVGCDGAYSNVRQNMFQQMKAKDLLPAVDGEDMAIGFVSMVGVADSQDLKKYPQLKDPFCHFSCALGKDNRSWGVCNVADNQVCWGLNIQLSEQEAKVQRFRNSEWGPESIETMIKEFQDVPSPWGGTMGEFIHATPKDLISKVFLEEKLFQTWYHSRTVLLGDACHKMLPGAGQGAVSAMQDAVVLANCIYNMNDKTPESLTAAFKDYREQRFDRVSNQYKASKEMSKILSGQTWSERFFRYIILNWIPSFLQNQQSLLGLDYRPQIAWLPLAENRGTVSVLPQQGKREPLAEQASAL
ncbi:hypothetical protein BC939DRAFT_497687 [Gamsiella multidivaricata]|uniref:uncharacterized protein n=1 Tax=Gamsiella multidivaricata TaxID=101098 RepID=UPI00221FFE33|nr:uncharacterized protein BC939DRAFT_497687 [Gamsiella multidivaricata]KAG0353655.1 hypothetical protein BGZ54_002144 [Gamsiella multidivaricata]KAI7816073.1 hypothetical protein BC939DRAFT_497687 [Gamsiella multidivaricata]